MQTIQTENYSIYFSDNGYKQLNEYISETRPTKIFFLVDNNSHEFCLPKLLSNLQTEAECEIIEIEQGEENKTIETVTQIWLALSELGADRKSLMINLGGGVVTDMGGFAASTYKRGISFINLPSTLLSMVDASIGGKTGIDLEGLKNQVGTFSFPEMIVIDTTFLQTLAKEQFRSGFAEMLKHGLIADKAHWKNLTHLDELSIEKVSPFIYDSILVKKKVVDQDPYEKGLRKILNFGHTIGHAIESHFLTTADKLLHGEAIFIGMIAEAYLGKIQGVISENDFLEIKNGIEKFYPPKAINTSEIPSIRNWMKHDKKNEAAIINFSLLESIGKCDFNVQVSDTELMDALDFLNQL